MPPYDLLSKIEPAVQQLRFFGIWPSPGAELRFFVIQFIFLIPHIIFSIIKLFLSFNDFQVIVKVSYIAPIIFVGALKSFQIRWFFKDFYTICCGIPKNRPAISATQNRILDDYMAKWQSFHFFMCYILIPIAALFWGLAPLFDSQERSLPFIAWYPFDHTKPVLYELVFAHQMIAMIFCAFINFDIDILMGGLMGYIAGECMVLENCLENMYEDTKRNGKISHHQTILEGMNATLIGLVEYHKEICCYGKKLEKLYNHFMMFQLAVDAPCMALTMILISTSGTESAVESLGAAFYYTGVASDFFNYCFFGNEVLYRSSSLGYAAFKSKWLDAPQNFKKNLLFFVHASRKPIILKTLFLFDFNMQTYIAVLRASYSYFALLQRVNRN